MKHIFLIKKAQLIYDFLKISTKIIYIEDIENDLFTKLNRILNSYKKHKNTITNMFYKDQLSHFYL